MLRLEPSDRRDVVGPAEAGIELLDEAGDVSGMPEACRQELGDGRVVLDEACERELADRLQHPEARFAVGIVTLAQQALLDQRGQAVEDVDAELPVRTADGLGSIEPASADEDAQSRKETALRLREELVTPRDSRPQRLLALSAFATT